MSNSEKHKTPLMNLYGIRDDVAGTFFPPFTSTNHGTAERSFRQMLADERGSLASSPVDYRLFFLADFDPDDGLIDPASPIELVASGAVVQSQPQSQP